jgi:hypothetical protein
MRTSRDLILTVDLVTARHSLRQLSWIGRVAQDYERLPETLAGFHFLAFAILMLTRFETLMMHRA